MRHRLRRGAGRACPRLGGVVRGELVVVEATRAGRVLVTDSLTYCDGRVTPLDVVVGGSFIGAYPAALALRQGARGVIGNAAGVGKSAAGIAGLALADRWDVPCAALSEQSARLADGLDSYRAGIVAHANGAARRLGIEPGQECAEAARRMLAAPPGERGRAAEIAESAPRVVWEGSEGRVLALPSVGLARPEHARSVLCAGSHAGLVTWRYVRGYTFPVAGVICNDAGVGKDRSGVLGLEPLARDGIAAAAVAHWSACIGDGESTFREGVVSFTNPLAEAAGVRVGLAAREAALRLLRARG